MKANIFRRTINAIVKFHKTSYTLKEDKQAANQGSRPVIIYSDKT